MYFRRIVSTHSGFPVFARRCPNRIFTDIAEFKVHHNLMDLDSKPRPAVHVTSSFRVNWEVTETLIYPPHPIYLLFGQARSRVFAFIPQNVVNPPVKVAQVSLLLTPFNELVSQCALKCGC